MLMIPDARRSISYILKTVWDNPIHRDALNTEAKHISFLI